LIGLDCGVNLNGYFSDMARTVAVGSVDAYKQKLIDVAKHSLDKGIDQIRPGKSIRAISQAIENAIVPHNFGIVRGFAGHGVGFRCMKIHGFQITFQKSWKMILTLSCSLAMYLPSNP